MAKRRTILMSLLIVSTPYPECAQTYIAVSIHVYMRHKVCACVCLLINTNTHMYLTNYVRMSHELCVLCICCCSSKQTHKYSIYIVSRDLCASHTNCMCLHVHADQPKCTPCSSRSILMSHELCVPTCACRSTQTHP